MHLLSIDYGTKNIGLAWCETGVGVVLPFGTVSGKNEVEKIQKLSSLIKEEKIDKIIIGLPMGLDGKENTNTERIKKFAFTLKQNISVPVEFINEMFSSHAADRMQGGASRDEKAAMVLLQDYLEKARKA